MKATGIIRRIDDLGRIVIPKEIRRVQLIDDNDPVEIFIEDDKIILRKYRVAEPILEILEKIKLYAHEDLFNKPEILTKIRELEVLLHEIK